MKTALFLVELLAASFIIYYPALAQSNKGLVEQIQRRLEEIRRLQETRQQKSPCDQDTVRVTRPVSCQPKSVTPAPLPQNIVAESSPALSWSLIGGLGGEGYRGEPPGSGILLGGSVAKEDQWEDEVWEASLSFSLGGHLGAHFHAPLRERVSVFTSAEWGITEGHGRLALAAGPTFTSYYEEWAVTPMLAVFDTKHRGEPNQLSLAIMGCLELHLDEDEGKKIEVLAGFDRKSFFMEAKLSIKF